MSKIEFIKELEIKKIIDYVFVIFNRCKTVDFKDSKLRWEAYNFILGNTFQDKSKLAIFMLVFFDSCKLEEIQEKLRGQDTMMDSLRKGEKKLKLKIIN